jgi:hypothetical protein
VEVKVAVEVRWERRIGGVGGGGGGGGICEGGVIIMWKSMEGGDMEIICSGVEVEIYYVEVEISLALLTLYLPFLGGGGRERVW